MSISTDISDPTVSSFSFYEALFVAMTLPKYIIQCFLWFHSSRDVCKVMTIPLSCGFVWNVAKPQYPSLYLEPLRKCTV